MAKEFSRNESMPLRYAHFDPHRRSGTPELARMLELFTGALEAAELEAGHRAGPRGPVGRRKFAMAVEAIVCNLLVLRALDPQRLLLVPLSHGVMYSPRRFRSEVFGEHFRDAAQILTAPAHGHCEVVSGGFKLPSGVSRQTAIRALPTFFEYFGTAALSLSAHTRLSNPAVLTLKGPKGEDGTKPILDFKETLRTQVARNEVNRLNAWLEAAPIFIDPAALTKVNAVSESLVDPTKRSLRRIFSNGKWNNGGRLFDGFWETMRRADRFRHLRIGSSAHPYGEPVANVDYGQLFPRLAYMRARTAAPEGDLYDVFGDGSSRAGVKQMLNALLFVKGTLGNWPDGARALFPEGMRLVDAIDAIAKRHQPIAKLFGTGIGHKLSYIESTVLLECLQKLWAEGTVALPLHDSVLVAASDALRARAVLSEVLDKYLPYGGASVVAIDIGS